MPPIKTRTRILVKKKKDFSIHLIKTPCLAPSEAAAATEPLTQVRHDLTTYINVFCSSRYSGHVWSVQAISVVCSPVFDDSGARVCLTTRVHGCAL